MDWLNKLRAGRQLRASRYRSALADLPPGLEAAWRQGASAEFPGIPTDAIFFVRAAEGLLGFFDAVSAGRMRCALPSLAADSVWHAWLRHDPIGLERFCRRHFGDTVPHLDAASLEQGALAQALVACRALEGIPAQGPALPRLFSLDSRLRMPRGHGYWARQGEVAYARLDGGGRRMSAALRQPELSLTALLAAGFISEQVYEEALRRQHAGDGGTTGSSSGSDGGGGCSDGGSDGGGGCSCGGGGGCGGGGD